MSLQPPQMGNRSMDFVFLSVSLYLYCSSLNTLLTMAADSISPGQSLTGEQTIISKEDRFVLGFFTPGNSQNYYIGIWFKKVTTQNVVWVANREAPLPDKSSQLKISEDGNLLLLSRKNTIVWSTNSTSMTTNFTVAVLQDNGNLVLRDGSKSSALIWQSFDYPTDTWLPTGWLGLNKITRWNQRLTSWRSHEDPAPGPFSLEFDPDGTTQYIVVWNGSQQYWRTGEWDGQIFVLVPEMRTRVMFNFSYEADEKGNLLTYTIYNTSTITRFVMDVSGQIKQLTWLEESRSWNLIWSKPQVQCEVYSLCGAFSLCQENQVPCKCLQGFEARSLKEWNLSDWSGGCVRKTRLQCESSLISGEGDKFLLISNLQLPKSWISLRVSSIDDCELACLNNCSCNAYAYDSGCMIWNSEITNLRVSSSDSSGKNLYLRLAASELRSLSSKKGKVTGAVIGTAAAAGAVALLGMVLVLIWRCRQRRMWISLKVTEGSLVAFSYRDLQMVTKNFSEKLGGGGFGSVSKGILPDLTAVAVKKLEGLTQGEKQFRTEVSTIGTVQHVNLIRLRGFCSEGEERLLVYDYMPNGSLDTSLFTSNPDTILNWKTRYKIALGTARGLAYLHEKCRDCILHCDIKPENVLLDATFCPKVADFGLAKLIGREFSRALTTMRGTRGYLAPEWISGSPVTSKADVFSYGMVLLEVISGRRNSEPSKDGKMVFFPTLASEKVIEGEVLSLLDHKLEGAAEMNELVRAARVACWCIQDYENHRPSMGQVVQILEGILEVNVPPIPRCLQIIAENLTLAFLSDTASSAHTSQAQTNASSSSQAKSSPSTSGKE